jgi:acetyltransferase-like isoleucine patch superfamily enzyme
MRKVSIPRNWDQITIEGTAALDDGVVLLCSGSSRPDKLLISAGTYVNRNTMFDASESITVGAGCMIGPGCYITDHDHGTTPDLKIAQQRLVSEPVRIGNNVWVGAGAIILKGVEIGDDAVIGAGSVVTKPIPPRGRVVGVPARPIMTDQMNAALHESSIK